MKAQNYLNQNYPLEQRWDVEKLSIINRDLTGTLKLEGFTNLKKLSCFGNQITKLEIVGSPDLEDISCSNNQLTELNVQNCPNLKIIRANNNFLTNLDLRQNMKLEELDIRDNNFYGQDLRFVTHLTNLEKLEVNNRDEIKIMGGFFQNGTCNRFGGSLEPLKNLTKLKTLNISNTHIKEGLEYLPNSVEDFYCLVDIGPEARVKNIYNAFANEQGVVELEGHFRNFKIKNFPQKLELIKKQFKDKAQHLFANELDELEALREENEALKLEAKTHFEALTEVAPKWRAWQLAYKLVAFNRVRNWQVDYLEKELDKLEEELDKSKRRIKELEYQNQKNQIEVRK